MFEGDLNMARRGGGGGGERSQVFRSLFLSVYLAATMLPLCAYTHMRQSFHHEAACPSSSQLRALPLPALVGVGRGLGL